MNHRQMGEERIETFKDGITINDLKEGDTIYIQKIISGYDYNFYCQFIKLERGIIHAKAISCNRTEINAFNSGLGEIITARKTSCFLWGKGKKDRWGMCHWLKKDGRFD